MKTQIHELRTRIDGLAQLVDSLKPIHVNVANNGIIGSGYKAWGYDRQSEELMDCHKSLFLAKAWLGKVLAELGEETPYKNDGNRKTVEDIELTADRFKVPELIDCGLGFDWNEASYIEKIDWLREKIKKLKVDFNDFVCDIEFADYDENFDLAQNHLTEARFHLGFELSRLKEQSK